MESKIPMKENKQIHVDLEVHVELVLEVFAFYRIVWFSALWSRLSKLLQEEWVLFICSIVCPAHVSPPFSALLCVKRLKTRTGTTAL